jgi:predicted RNA-binding Zn-ribbon protein involved in translation (DUF1610 family)
MSLQDDLNAFLDNPEDREIPFPRAEETGNCPNCAEVVIRELIYRNNVPIYYWPCPHCGYTHHGADIPALD